MTFGEIVQQPSPESSMADTAYETFKVAFGRAVYLYRLYHGLTNHRQRAMRSDWASNFCRLMH